MGSITKWSCTKSCVGGALCTQVCVHHAYTPTTCLVNGVAVGWKRVSWKRTPQSKERAVKSHNK